MKYMMATAQCILHETEMNELEMGNIKDASFH
jgi:hypothetical protein